MSLHMRWLRWFGIVCVCVVGVVLSCVAGLYLMYGAEQLSYYSFTPREHLFEVQSIDTMKISRDEAAQALDNPVKFRQIADTQMQLIADAGATHVAIGTPYDTPFLPALRLWVASARAHGLKVWFRGNFAGWEGWFNDSKIDRDEHTRLLRLFIANNAALFETGDLFSPCPECENGGPGDPRQTGDRKGYNSFLITEGQIAQSEFLKQNKEIAIFTSMNADIARGIITPGTARLLGGSLLVDHYVTSATQFSDDIADIASMLNASVGVGEFGAPIPDLNGTMTSAQQASYIGRMLGGLAAQHATVPVVNYWVLSGGSTALVSDAYVPRPAYFEMQRYFKTPSVYGMVYNTLGEAVLGATITVASTTESATTYGTPYQLFLLGDDPTITVSANGYTSVSQRFDGATTTVKNDFYLEPEHPSYLYRARDLLYRTLRKLDHS